MSAPEPIRLDAAHKTKYIVNREPELKRIYDALYSKGNVLRVVLIRGGGGLGKTRLLEEMLWRAGNFSERNRRSMTDADRAEGLDWTSDSTNRTVVSNLVDLIDIRLHARNRFLRAIRDGLQGPEENPSPAFPVGISFPNYDEAYDRLQRMRAYGAEYRYIQQAAEEAEQAFLSDMQAATKTQRIAWVFDTVEQLKVVTSDWLISRNLLTSKDMKRRTRQWLVDVIEQGVLQNLTIVLAGRGGEKDGQKFFEVITQAIEKARPANHRCELETIDAAPFDDEGTRKYFAMLGGEWRHENSKNTQAVEPSRIADQLDYVADAEHDRYKVIRLYTDGIPVRLALYAQLIIENKTIPELLHLSYEDAILRANIPPTGASSHSTPELDLIRWKVEDEFIDLLFNRPDTPRQRILQALVRAPRGLDLEQLHYLLDSKEQKPEDWVANPQRLQELHDELEDMKSYYLVKRREYDRIGLQDEIYRIYAEHMAPDKDPQTESVREIWQGLDPAEQRRYKGNWEDEKAARADLYMQLRDWTEHQRKKYVLQQMEFVEEDERGLNLVADDPKSFSFKAISESETDERAIVQETARALRIENMIYAFLLNPESDFNTEYTDLADEKTLANDEDADFLTQAEMWRVLHDDYALKFVEFRDRSAERLWPESPILILRRAAEQEDVARWIKRFVIFKEYRRALEFVKEVEGQVEKLKSQDEKNWFSWSHTLVRGERLAWAKYAQILATKDVEKAIAELKRELPGLLNLADRTTQQEAVDRSGYVERGFKGDRAQGIQAHPAETRLKRVIAQVYNALGYASTNVGKIRAGVSYYGKALYYLRETGAISFRANVLNNLSRALSELGRRGERVCLDGLELRKQIGAEVPIAYSYNTLALIYNDQGRPDEAWSLAAKAVAYFRRTDETRGLGLALLQLAEALRRLAGRAPGGAVPEAKADSLYSAADTLAKEAHGIFLPSAPGSKRPNLDEPLRLIEAKIELGCLYRDRTRRDRSRVESGRAPRWELRYREALTYLQDAAKLSRQLGLLRLEVDALGDVAWTHFFAGKFEEAENALRGIKNILPQECIMTPTFIPIPTERNDVWVFHQLSKIYGLHGRLAMERFKSRLKEIEQQLPDDPEKRHIVVHSDEVAQKQLFLAAEAYTLAALYAQFYTPRGPTLTVVYDNLYSYLKHFNGVEFDDFREYVRQQYQRYPVAEAKSKLEDVGSIAHVLREYFGADLQGEELEY